MMMEKEIRRMGNGSRGSNELVIGEGDLQDLYIFIVKFHSISTNKNNIFIIENVKHSTTNKNSI